MKDLKTWFIIIPAALALGGLLFIQSKWLDKAVQLNEQEMEKNARMALVNVLHNKNILPGFAENGSHIPVQLNQNQKDSIVRLLRPIIKSLFTQEQIDDPFELGITCCNNNVVVSSDNDLNDQLSHSKIKVGLERIHSYEHGYHLAIYFKSKSKFLLRHLGIELGISMILLIILIGIFCYTFISLRKQKKLSQVKNDFINNMTHELKTPIASIRLASRMLDNEKGFSEKQHSYLKLIDKESIRLENQVDKVLQMAMIESGNLQLEIKQIDMHGIIQNVVDNFRLIIEKMDGNVALDLRSENHLIRGDSVHVTNVLYNLLDNAIKYNDEKPEIFISTSDIKEGIMISVKDNGIGIDPEARNFIFEKFYRGQKGDIYSVKGFGLGLSYVKHIIDAHKGSISFSSNPGLGTEFKVFLPAI